MSEKRSNMENKDPLKVLVTRCDCGDSHHIMQFELWTWNDSPPDFYVSVQLNPISWPKRLWYAFCYVIGRRSKYSWGHWDIGGIGLESAKVLAPMLAEYIVQSQTEKSETITKSV